jgi:hypothetical protein
MRRHSELHGSLAQMFLKTDVTAPLSYYYPAITLKCTNNLSIGQAGDMAHRANSSTSAFSGGMWSSSVGSR